MLETLLGRFLHRVPAYKVGCIPFETTCVAAERTALKGQTTKAHKKLHQQVGCLMLLQLLPLEEVICVTHHLTGATVLLLNTARQAWNCYSTACATHYAPTFKHPCIPNACSTRL